MIKINMRDGRTIGLDLSLEEGSAAWTASRADPSFQSNITAISIQNDGWQHAVPLPSGARHPDFDAELILADNKPVGESITCLTDDFNLKFTVYYTGVTRVDVTKRVWRQKFASRRDAR